MIDEADANWLRERFDAVADALSQSMAEKHSLEPLDGGTTAAFGTAIAYVEVGSQLGALDRVTAMELLRSYLDDDYWSRSTSAKPEHRARARSRRQIAVA